jgi:hypothetical protein
LLTAEAILPEEESFELSKEVLTAYTGSLDGLVELQTQAFSYQMLMELVSLIEEDTITQD